MEGGLCRAHVAVIQPVKTDVLPRLCVQLSAKGATSIVALRSVARSAGDPAIAARQWLPGVRVAVHGVGHRDVEREDEDAKPLHVVEAGGAGFCFPW